MDTVWFLFWVVMVVIAIGFLPSVGDRAMLGQPLFQWSFPDASKPVDITEWNRWYAWYPVKLKNGDDWVWLGKISRRWEPEVPEKHIIYTDAHGSLTGVTRTDYGEPGFWEYRL